MAPEVGRSTQAGSCAHTRAGAVYTGAQRNRSAGGISWRFRNWFGCGGLLRRAMRMHVHDIVRAQAGIARALQVALRMRMPVQNLIMSACAI